MVTLTDVEVSPDHAHAKVFFTSLGDRRGRGTRHCAGLQRAAGFLRSELGAAHQAFASRRSCTSSTTSRWSAACACRQLIDEAVASDAARHGRHSAAGRADPPRLTGADAR